VQAGADHVHCNDLSREPRLRTSMLRNLHHSSQLGARGNWRLSHLCVPSNRTYT
jgi:hypothetical protein